MENMAIKIFIFGILVNTGQILPMPGDHAGLTCTHTATLENIEYYSEYHGKITDDSCPVNPKSPYQPSLCAALSNPDTRESALQYVSDNRAAIQNQVRMHHDTEYHVTVWGDSLSDFVNIYGITTYEFWADRGYSGVLNFSGDPIVIDSFDDYFANFGTNFTHIKFRNYGVAGETSTGLLSNFRIELKKNYELGIWDASEKTDRCQVEKQNKAAVTNEMITVNHNHKTPMRSMMMIGGNDVLGGAVTASLFPYLGNAVIEQVAENISFITDWHIENGKQILLLGTIPIKSKAIGPYDYTIADRESLCHPVTDLLIQPEEFPWWVCGFGPGICVAALTGAAAHNQQIIDAFDNFQHELFYGSNSDPAGLASINQACINDRVTQIGNVYSQVYPNNVFIRPLYNSFNNTGSGIKTANFWVPQEAMYGGGDPIHIGPLGYKRWAEVAGPYLKELGWHIAPVLPNDSPVPPVDFTNDGPGKYIQTKAKSAGIWGKQTGGITPVIADGLGKGFYQDYGGSRIYLKMLRGLDLSGAETTPRYSPAFIVKGEILSEYKAKGDAGGWLGWPRSDQYYDNSGLVWPNTIERSDFECGSITNNTLDFLNGPSVSGSSCNYW